MVFALLMVGQCLTPPTPNSTSQKVAGPRARRGQLDLF
jgi:hypothetical protein